MLRHLRFPHARWGSAGPGNKPETVKFLPHQDTDFPADSGFAMAVVRR
jgi:hypothetical protein